MDPHVNFDFDRSRRTGLPEVIYSEGKSKTSLINLLNHFAEKNDFPVLFTRLKEDVFLELPEDKQKIYFFDSLAGTAYNCCLPQAVNGSAAIVTAGTSDGSVAFEALRTLEYLNVECKIFEDCGVSGLWRLQEKFEEINRYDMIIAVAGMEAALPGVVAGLSPRPVIGVPTSVGYGICEQGKTALRSMLASCVPGISVVNIDNGFGAACVVHKTLISCKGYK